MSLTGLPLRVLLVIVMVIAIGAAIRFAPRVAGRRSAHVLGRLGIVLGCQICVIVTALDLVNASFAFYGSWGDLVGAGSSVSDVGAHAAGGPRAQPAPTAPVTADPRAPKYRLAAGQGRIDSIVIHGVRTAISEPAYVYLPPQYFARGHGALRFPVTVAFTGYPGNAANLITHLGLPQAVAKEVAARRMPPTIVVMLRPSVSPPRDTECTDVPHGPQAETFFAEDVPAALAAVYRTSDHASGWSAMGDSTGGYCAVKLAMRHSDRYSAAVSLAGYYHALQDFTTGNLYGHSRTYREENDLLWRLQHRPPPPVDLLLTTSRVGEKDYRQTREFLALVRPPTHVASITLPFGGHHFSTWQRELPSALRWLGARLKPGG